MYTEIRCTHFASTYMRAYKQRADVNLFDQPGFLLFNQYFSCRDKLNYAQNEAGEKKIVGRFKRYFNILDSKKALGAELNDCIQCYLIFSLQNCISLGGFLSSLFLSR